MAVGKRERIRFDENGNEIKKPTRYYSTKQEKKVASTFNGRQTKNSGATPFDSGDVTTALKAGNNIRGALIGSGVAASHGMERTHIKGIINTFELVKAYVLN